jgi:hypothetical protein
MLTNPVAAEKLAHFDFAKIASRQEALQTIFSSLLDISYHPISDLFQKNRVFQQPRMLSIVTSMLVSTWAMFTEPISIDSFVSAGTAESLSVFV